MYYKADMSTDTRTKHYEGCKGKAVTVCASTKQHGCGETRAIMHHNTFFLIKSNLKMKKGKQSNKSLNALLPCGVAANHWTPALGP